MVCTYGYERYQCLDKKCVTHYIDCKSENEVCPFYKPYWCADSLLCAVSDEACMRPCGFQQERREGGYHFKCIGFDKCVDYQYHCPPECHSPTLERCPQDGYCVQNITQCKPCADLYSKRCVSDAKCYTQEKWCNDVQDCDDGSDEVNCPGNRHDQWIIAAFVFSIFVILIVVAMYLGYMRYRNQLIRRRRRESLRSFQPATSYGSQPPGTSLQPDRLRSFIVEDPAMCVGSQPQAPTLQPDRLRSYIVEEPATQPLVPTLQPDRLRSYIEEEPELQVGLPESEDTTAPPPPFVNLYTGPTSPSGPTHMTIDFSYNSTIPANSHPRRGRLSQGAISELNSTDTDTALPSSLYTAVTDCERGTSPPPAYEDAIAHNRNIVRSGNENDGLPTYEESIHADLEQRIKEQESEIR